MPPGWTVSPSNGAGSSINLTIPGGTAADDYVISANSHACVSGVISLTVNVKPATPAITSGPTCVDRNGGSAQVYTATSSPGATGYVWNIPAGWTCITCSGTTAILLPGGTGTGPENLTVTALGTNGCDATSAAYVVNYNPVTPASISVNCWNFGINGNTTLTVGNAPGFGSYDIIDPSGVLLSGFTPTATGATLHTLGTAPAGSYTLLIRHQTAGCGVTSYVSFTFTFGGNGASIGSVLNPGMGNSDIYYVLGAPSSPPSTYQWFVDGVPAGTGSTLTRSGNPPGPIQVCVNVAHNGCITRLCTAGGTHSRPAGTDEIGNKADRIRVFPNPNTGDFTIDIPTFLHTASVSIMDASGREVAHRMLTEGGNQISQSNLAAGTYFLLLRLDGEVKTHKIQVLAK